MNQVFKEKKDLFLAFENDAQRTTNKRYYLPNIEMKDYIDMIDGKNFFNQPKKKKKKHMKTLEKLPLANEMITQLAVY